MGSTLLGIDHVALVAWDLPATERFYGEVLGLPITQRMGGVSKEWDGRAWQMRIFQLPDGGGLDFFAVEGAERPEPRGWLDTIAHVAIGVPTRADLEAWRKKLELHGHPVLEEQDHGEGRHSLYFADPNGYFLELTCRPNS